MAVHGAPPSVRNDSAVAAGMAAALPWAQVTPHRRDRLPVASAHPGGSHVQAHRLFTRRTRQLDTADCELSAADAASEAAARPTVGLYPSSCAQKTADGASVHAQLDGCTGAFGRVELNGGLDATLEVTGDCKLRADIVDSGDLSANGRELTYDATADIELLEGARDVTWNAHWIGSTRRGREIEQTSQLRVLIDDASHCLNVEGSAEGHVAQYDYGWEASGLSVCPDTCPSAGSVRAHWQGRGRDREISVEFDGSNVAHVVGWSGSEFDVEMVCTGTEPAPAE